MEEEKKENINEEEQPGLFYPVEKLVKKRSWEETITQIKAKVKITDLANFKGNRIECRDGNTSIPALVYYPDTETFCCFKCNEKKIKCSSGDVINFYAYINRIERKEAFSYFCEKYKLTFSEKTLIEIEEKEEIFNEIFPKFMQYAHDELLFECPEYLEKIKNKRGLNEKTLKLGKIGIFNNNIRQLLEKTYSEKTLKNAGFKTKNGAWNIYCRDKEERWECKNLIVSPYLNQQNQPIYFIYRTPPGEKKGFLKHITTKYVKNRIYGLNNLKNKNKDTIIICEGSMDVLSVLQCSPEQAIISPITKNFPKSETDNFAKICKNYTKTVIINDNDEKVKEGKKYGEGLSGAINEAKKLYEKRVSVYIGEIEKTESRKEDLDSYLMKGTTNENQKKMLDEIMENSIPLLNFLILPERKKYDLILKEEEEKETIKVSEKGKIVDDLLHEIIDFIPMDNNTIISQLANIFRKNFKFEKSSFYDTIKRKKLQIKAEQKKIKEKEYKEKEKKREEKELKDDDFEIISWKDKVDIVKKRDLEGNFLLYLRYENIDKEGNSHFNDVPFFQGNLKLLHKTLNANIEFFNFKIDNRIFYTFSLKDMFNFLYDYTQEGNLGRDGVKQYIHTKRKKLPTRKLTQIIGWDNGWKLPHLEEKLKIFFDLTQTQHNKVYYSLKKNFKTYIKEEKGYSEEKKEEIKKDLKQLIKLTEIKEDKLNIILCWCICAPFRQVFIKYFDLYPLLLLLGERVGGKTSILKTFALDFYKIWRNYFGSRQLEIAQLEMLLSTSTFPIMIDEAKYINLAVVEILKAQASGNPSYLRQYGGLGSKRQIDRPKIASFCLTANTMEHKSLDTALNTKAFPIYFELDEKVKENSEWKNTRSKLKKINLFSLVYDYTKDWDDNYIINKYFKKFEQELEFNKFKGVLERYQSYFSILLFGRGLYKEIFGIDLNILKCMDVLSTSRTQSQSEITDQFVEYVIKAKNCNPTKNEHWLVPLRQQIKKEGYFFTQEHLAGFKFRFKHNDLAMKDLISQLKDGLEKKKKFLINYVRTSIQGITIRGIKIEQSFFDDNIGEKKN